MFSEDQQERVAAYRRQQQRLRERSDADSRAAETAASARAKLQDKRNGAAEQQRRKPRKNSNYGDYSSQYSDSEASESSRRSYSEGNDTASSDYRASLQIQNRRRGESGGNNRADRSGNVQRSNKPNSPTSKRVSFTPTRNLNRNGDTYVDDNDNEDDEEEEREEDNRRHSRKLDAYGIPKPPSAHRSLRRDPPSISYGRRDDDIMEDEEESRNRARRNSKQSNENNNNTNNNNNTSTNAAANPQIPVSDIAAYVEQLESQNRELRSNIMELQETLYRQQHLQQQQQPVAPVPQGNTRVASAPISAESANASGALGSILESVGPIPSDVASEEDKQRYVNDVLAQVSTMIRVHRNKTDAEIRKYKADAEEAKTALKQLRNALAVEGVELSVLPALLGSSRKHGTEGSANEYGTAVPDSRTILPTWIASGDAGIATKRIGPVMEAITEELLDCLLAMEAGDDVQQKLTTAIERCFLHLVRQFATQLETTVKANAAETRRLRSELDEERKQMAHELQRSETRRAEQLQQYEAEVLALKDEIHAFHVAASGGDDVQGSIHQQTLDEYSRMLTEARQEIVRLKRVTEEIQNSTAEASLKLKSTLRKRNEEFEAAIMEQARVSIAQREETIAELKVTVEKLQKEVEVKKLTTRSIGIQAGSSDGQPQYAPTEENFVHNLLAAFKPLRAQARSGGKPLHELTNHAPSDVKVSKYQEQHQQQQQQQQQQKFQLQAPPRVHPAIRDAYTANDQDSVIQGSVGNAPKSSRVSAAAISDARIEENASRLGTAWSVTPRSTSSAIPFSGLNDTPLPDNGVGSINPIPQQQQQQQQQHQYSTLKSHSTRDSVADIVHPTSEAINISFESDVWGKTQELLKKYGRNSTSSGPVGSS